MEFSTGLHHRQRLLADRVTDAEVRAAIGRGHLTRLARGVYVRPDVLSALTPEERYALAARAVGARSPGLIVSHAAAAALYGLPLPHADLQRVHLTRPGRGGSDVSPQRVIHAGRVDPDEICVVDGVRATTVPRTLLDLACTESRATAVAAADAALHGGLTSAAELEDALAGAPCRRGLPAVRRAWACVDGRAESPGESLARLIMADAGLPTPQFVILAEKRREERLTELGWLVIRLIWADLWRPEQLARRLASAARARRHLVSGIRGRAIPAAPVTVSVPR